MWLIRQLNCCIFLWSFKNHAEIKKSSSLPVRSDFEILMNLQKSRIPANCFVTTCFYFKTFCLSLSDSKHGFICILESCPNTGFARFLTFRFKTVCPRLWALHQPPNCLASFGDKLKAVRLWNLHLIIKKWNCYWLKKSLLKVPSNMNKSSEIIKTII